MLTSLFLRLTYVGAEWVLYLLIFLSVISVAVILERLRFYRVASRGLPAFRAAIRKAATDGKLTEAMFDAVFARVRELLSG